MKLVIGIDFGSDSARAIVTDVQNGKKVGEGVWEYTRWSQGKYCDSSKRMFRQHPLDYIEALTESVRGAVEDARGNLQTDVREMIVALAVDTTGSTPCPVDREGSPLALLPGFEENPNGMFWLWKDHTAIEEAKQINEVLKNFEGEDYTRFQGTYSSEWYWAKILHALRTDSQVREKAYAWVEHCDWIPGLLTGNTRPDQMYRCSCAAGHKALWHSDFEGLPPKECLGKLDPSMAEIIEHYGTSPRPASWKVGVITEEWAKKLGLSNRVIIGGSSLDAHAGAVGAGVGPGILVKVVGTSTVDMLIEKRENLRGSDLKDCCGQAEDSIVPGYVGIEAGQAAFGDLYSWYKRLLMWPTEHMLSHVEGLSAGQRKKILSGMRDSLLDELCAQAQKEEQEDLVVVDWFNGRRYPMINEDVKGAVNGLTLGTTAVQLFRAIVLSTVLGSRRIFDSFTTRGIAIKEVITVGGIAKKSPLVMQMMADVLKRPIKVARSEQACAQGAAMYAAVASGCYKSLPDAQEKMFEGFEKIYMPEEKNFSKYDILYKKYLTLGCHVEEIQLKEQSVGK